MKHFNRNIIILAACALLASYIPLPAVAQIEGGALNYMLQRPRVAKYYKQKHAFDHLFLDGGAGVNLLGSHDMNLGATSSFTIGDWLSPEHGVRLGVDGGFMRIGDAKVKYVTTSLDYLLNVTAIATPGNNYRQKPIELYGIAGVDYSFSRHQGQNGKGFGVHIGARGQFAMSPFTYFYIEPKFGLMQSDVSQTPTWRGFRPMGTMSVGFGYRLPDAPSVKSKDESQGYGDFANGLFLTSMGGMAIMANNHPSTWDDNIGMRALVGVGKWINASNGVRLSLGATTMRLPSTKRLKAVDMQLDYMLNLHNAFGGRNEHRLFWVNAIAGASYNYSSEYKYDARYSWGFGGGLQANFRLSDAFALVVEPRLDVYNKRWIPSSNSFRKYDAAASLMAGLTYTYNAPKARAAHANDEQEGLNVGSIGVSAGLMVPAAYCNKWNNYMPVGRLTYTHWSAPLTGVRYGLQGMIGRNVNDKRYAQATVTVDWLADLTALSYGCTDDRVLSLRTVVGTGIGAAYRRPSVRLASDVHVGVQAAVRLSPALSLTAEPQVAYNFSPLWKGRRLHRVQPQVQVGLEYSLRRSTSPANLGDKPSKSHFSSVSIGTGAYTGNIHTASRSERYTFFTDMSYGQWLNQVSGVQAGVSNTVVQHRGKRHNQNLTAVHADYVMNIKSAIMGESTEEHLFQLTGVAGAQLGISSERGRDTRVAPGLHGAIQAGVRVSPSVEIYLEPSATIYSKKIEAAHSNHPADGELRLSIGTKIHF